MRMIGTLRRLVAGMAPADIFARAKAGDAAFFQAQFAPVRAVAANIQGHDVIVFHQLERVMDLDADYAVMILGPTLRAFVTEAGIDFMTGKPNHFLVEADPFAAGPGARKGNMGTIEVPNADLPTVALDLTTKVLAKISAP